MLELMLGATMGLWLTTQVAPPNGPGFTRLRLGGGGLAQR